MLGRELADGRLYGRLLGAHGVDAGYGVRLVVELVEGPACGTGRCGIARLDVEDRGRGIGPVGVDPEHRPIARQT